MTLTNDNYFGLDAAREYMSTSQYKSFCKCPAAALAEINGEYVRPQKAAFVEGHLFEGLVSGGVDEIAEEFPEVVASRGEHKGRIKSSYQKIVTAAERFNAQEKFREIVARCDKQVLVTGTINGVKFRGLLDLYNPETGEIYDTKCMRDFAPVYSPDEGRKVPWWQYWGYHYQAAIYSELVRQTFGKCAGFSLLAATKEDTPDLAWISFDSAYLRNVLDIVEETAPMYQAIKDGLIDAERCETCDYCKSTKVIYQPQIIQVSEEYND